MELIETPTFARQITALLSDEEYGAFQSRLAANPGFGALIKGGGGIRNAWRLGRAANAEAFVSSTTGRSRDLILLLYAYPKSVSADLTPKQVAQLAKVVKQEFRQ